MAITKSAKRALRGSTGKRVVNDKIRRTLREKVKHVRDEVSKNNLKTAVKDLALAFKALDKAAKKGVIKKGTANRKKARLAKAIAKATKK